MYGKYPLWRGQQVASGRFGVTSEMLNSSYLVEIKIGQGAKPGEGGHLPAKKVSEKVAAARNASPGTDLISPSNNHDLYSIEDLAELIDELKTANPDVRVSVKVPVVPNIGTIGVGIAKAGADIITLSGFEGGTGAARQHALRHVGLPSDIGTRAVHLALLETGIRNRVEIWADGGYRHGWDIVKLHCLGANRVAFGTLAMVSLGCTICRGCQLDTCHVGIATQIEDMAEAEEKGLKKFTPQEFELAAENCARFFAGMGEEVRQIVADLGYERAQDLVGRSDLLVQSRAKEAIDLTEMIRPLEEMLDLEPIDMPVSAEEEREAAGLIVARPIRMEPKQASREIAALAADVCGGPVQHRRRDRPAAGDDGWRRSRSPRTGRVAHEYQRAVDANDRVLGTELAGALSRARIYRPDDAPPSTMDTVADLHFNGGSIGGSGLGAFNVWGVDIRVEGGAQDGVGKTMFGGTIAIMKGTNRLGRARQRLGRQVVRLRRAARPLLRAGLGRLALLHPAVGRRRRDRRRARGPDPRRPRRDRRPRQHQGLRVRVHDLGPRRRARRHRPVGLRRPDRRPRLHARQRRVGPRPRGARAPARQGREGRPARARRRGRVGRPGAARPLRATSSSAPTSTRRRSASARSRRDAAAHFLMSVPEREQTDPSVSTE